MNHTKALITIALLGLLAAGLFYLMGAYGVIFAGVAGVCAAFGMRWVDAEKELRAQHYTIAPSEDPMLDSQYAEGTGKWAWLWTALVLAVAAGLIVLGFALAAAEYPPRV